MLFHAGIQKLCQSGSNFDIVCLFVVVFCVCVCFFFVLFFVVVVFFK